MGSSKPGEQGAVSDAVAHRTESVRRPKGVHGGGTDYPTVDVRELVLEISDRVRPLLPTSPYLCCV